MILEFPAPARALSINKVNGAHWATYHKDKKAWQMAAKVAWYQRQPKATHHDVAVPSTVQVVIPFKVNRTRDPHNFTDTVVKWIVDGLKYGGAWPDDTEEWVEILDSILVKDPDLLVKVEIKPR